MHQKFTKTSQIPKSMRRPGYHPSNSSTAVMNTRKTKVLRTAREEKRIFRKTTEFFQMLNVGVKIGSSKRYKQLRLTAKSTKVIIIDRAVAVDKMGMLLSAHLRSGFSIISYSAKTPRIIAVEMRKQGHTT
mmetsp:Transcript_6697/g.10243  ORF Transcript_6697/g.10243 Transcript_6697/m.10243 type:complete len:131 (-) Transcript_6697:492-884(-)